MPPKSTQKRKYQGPLLAKDVQVIVHRNQHAGSSREVQETEPPSKLTILPEPAGRINVIQKTNNIQSRLGLEENTDPLPPFQFNKEEFVPL